MFVDRNELIFIQFPQKLKSHRILPLLLFIIGSHSFHDMQRLRAPYFLYMARWLGKLCVIDELGKTPRGFTFIDDVMSWTEDNVFILKSFVYLKSSLKCSNSRFSYEYVEQQLVGRQFIKS